MGYAVLQPLRVGLSRFATCMNWGVFERPTYGVDIEPLIRGSVDAVRQHCPAKRQTPMGLVARESAGIMRISSMTSDILVCILEGDRVIGE